jgi:hypothetical protein
VHQVIGALRIPSSPTRVGSVPEFYGSEVLPQALRELLGDLVRCEAAGDLACPAFAFPKNLCYHNPIGWVE